MLQIALKGSRHYCDYQLLPIFILECCFVYEYQKLDIAVHSCQSNQCAKRDTFFPGHSNISDLHMLEVIRSHYILGAGYSECFSESVQDSWKPYRTDQRRNQIELVFPVHWWSRYLFGSVLTLGSSYLYI